MSVSTAKLHRRAIALCRQHSLPSDAACDASQEALLLALERGARDVWAFAYASLGFIVLKMESHSRAAAERGLRYLQDAPVRRLSEDEADKRRERVKAASVKRWEGRSALCKKCEHCEKEFEAVNSKGRNEKRRRFCTKSCANKHHHHPKPSTS